MYPLPADALHMFARWPDAHAPPTILQSLRDCNTVGTSLKAMRVWLRRRSPVSAAGAVAAGRLRALASLGYDQFCPSALGESSFAAAAAAHEMQPSPAPASQSAAQPAAGCEAAAALPEGAARIYASAAAAGLIAPPHDRPEVLPAFVAQHWCLPAPCSLALHSSSDTRAGAAVLREPVRCVPNRVNCGKSHMAHGCTVAQPFVLPLACTEGASAAVSPEDAQARQRAAGYMGSACDCTAGGSAAEPGAIKLTLPDAAAAQWAGSAWPSDGPTRQHMTQLTSDRGLNAHPAKTHASDKVAEQVRADAARAARDHPPGKWTKRTALSAADELRLQARTPFEIAAVDGVDIAAAERDGAATLGVAKRAVDTVKTLAYVRIAIIHLFRESLRTCAPLFPQAWCLCPGTRWFNRSTACCSRSHRAHAANLLYGLSLLLRSGPNDASVPCSLALGMATTCAAWTRLPWRSWRVSCQHLRQHAHNLQSVSIMARPAGLERRSRRSCKPTRK